MKISEIKKNPKNPRVIKGTEFERLKASITDFPQMMELRPIVIDESNMILGGNMRFEAVKALGFKELPEAWVVKAADLTDEQKRAFVIKDNGSHGEWNFDALANEWNDLPLDEWGLWIPDVNISDIALLEDEEGRAAPGDKPKKSCPNCGHEF